MEQVGRKRRRRFYGAGSKEEMIAQVRDLYEQGFSQHEIAKKIGIPRGTISRWMIENGIKGRDSKEEGIKKSRIYQYDENFFSCINTYDKAYIVGFILGDGYISDTGKRKRLGITLALEDRQILDDIAEYMGVKDLVKIRNKTYENEQQKISLIINCTKMCDDLIKLGIKPQKTKNEKWITFDEEGLQWAFLRGLFDADGYARVYKREDGYIRVKMSITNSLDVCTGIKDFLESQSIPLRNKPIYKKEGCYAIELTNKEAVKMIAGKMYSYGSLKLNRKFDIISSLMI